MNKTHFKDSAGEDHVIQSSSLDTRTGKFLVWFTCCTQVDSVTPEEFAMSYSVRPSSDN